MAETGCSTRWRVSHVIAVVVVVCPLVTARTIHVANDGPADHTTIQAAIDDADDGDVVLVAPGAYTGGGNRDIDFRGKAITVKGEGGPTTCIIDCQGSRDEYHRGFVFTRGEGASSTLEGFTITRGYTQEGGSGVLCERSSPSIRECFIAGNRARNAGVGIQLSASDSIVENSIISGNYIVPPIWGSEGGAGIYCSGLAGRNAYPLFRNCTIVGNRGSGSGAGVRCGTDGVTRIENCIVVGNIVTAPVPNGTQVSADGCMTPASCMDVEIRNCAVEDVPNAVFVGAWSLPDRTYPPVADYIKVDPYFADPGHWEPNDPATVHDDFWVQGDYHLKSKAGRWYPSTANWVQDDVTSPCIDAGIPNDPVVSEPLPNGGRINIGAYAGTAEASKSLSAFVGKYGGGSGVEGNPYLIFTAEQFDAMGAEPGDWDKHFVLMADVDLSGYPGGELHIVGLDAASPFSGVFDGGGHKISGLGRNSSADFRSAPLFGYVIGTVKDVGLIDPNVGGRLLYYTGSLVGDNHGLVSNCYAEDVNVVGGGWHAGGLVGWNSTEGTMIDCNSTGVVRDRCAGGLVGKNAGTMTGCRTAAVVIGNSPVGGLAGTNVNGTIANSCSYATVTGDDRTGGLVGHNFAGTITACYSAAVVTGNDGVGGLLGENAGGLVINCYSMAHTTGDRLTGALVGDSGGGAITNCYAAGPTTGRWPVGGITHWRHDDDVVTGCFWDMETTGCSLSAAGTGKTTVEMQTAATFLAAGWDFVGETANGSADIWRIAVGQDYPRLSWEPDPNDGEPLQGDPNQLAN